MSQSLPHSTRDHELARQINEDVRTNPNSGYRGKFVGIARGQVVAVGTTLDELMANLLPGQTDLSEVFCFEAGLDYDQVQDVWGVG